MLRMYSSALAMNKQDENDLKSLIKKTVKEAKENSIKTILKEENILGKFRSISSLKEKVYSKLEDKDIFKWNNKDFSRYTKNLYYQKYNQNWYLSIINLSTYFGNIKESIHNTFGFCDSLITKDYLDFFFHNGWADYYMNNNKCINIYDLRDKKPVSSFASSYDYKQRVLSYTQEDKKENNSTIRKNKTTPSAMKKSILLGLENFLIEYGIVWSINYLSEYHGNEKKDAIINVIRECIRMHKKGNLEIAIKTTLDMSPYPLDLNFRDIEAVIKIINKKVNSQYSLNISFEKGIKNTFIRRKNNK